MGAALLTLLLTGALITLYFTTPEVKETVNEGYQLAKTGDEEALATWFAQFGIWGPLAIVAFMILQMFLIVFPSWLPMIVATVGYGPVWGVLIAVAGVMAASIVGYGLGWFFGEKARGQYLENKQKASLSKALHSYGYPAIVLFRLSPFLSTDAISIFAGILGMRFVPYLLATLAGITPLAIGIAYFTRDLEQLETGLYWLTGIGILLYALYIWLDRKHKRS